MENLVRRLGRIFFPEKTIERSMTERNRRRMDRLEGKLAEWTRNKGWRVPLRTMGDVAQQLDTDTAVLFHFFEERMGMDFRTWRTRLRLEDAMQLLLEEPEATASEISARVGFSNRSNFSRQFLAYTGLTPAQWRKKARISPDIQALENDYV